nr:DUF3306 domain-containing protein [uncultured Noviherbaspirillum sp.]
MSADDFFSRWSRRKAEAGVEPAPDAGSAATAEPAPELPPPTLEDVAALGHDADFSRFVKPGVDETVRRSAMKKLFTDPHFNVMDGLDIYIGDYNTFEPLPPAMLAMLAHAKPLLDPLGHLQQPAMKMLDRLEQLAGTPPAQGDAQEPDAAAAPEPATQLADDGQAIDIPVVNSPGPDVPGPETPVAESPGSTASPDNDHTI